MNIPSSKNENFFSILFPRIFDQPVVFYVPSSLLYSQTIQETFCWSKHCYSVGRFVRCYFSFASLEVSKDENRIWWKDGGDSVQCLFWASDDVGLVVFASLSLSKKRKMKYCIVFFLWLSKSFDGCSTHIIVRICQ